MTLPVLNVAAFQAKVYPSPPCWSLVADVYTSVLQEPLDGFRTIGESVRSAARAFRLQLHKDRHGFQQVDDPSDYAVVLMGRTPQIGVHHCGIFYGGSILHAMDTGTLYQDVGTLRATYQLMEFWSRS